MTDPNEEINFGKIATSQINKKDEVSDSNTITNCFEKDEFKNPEKIQDLKKYNNFKQNEESIEQKQIHYSPTNKSKEFANNEIKNCSSNVNQILTENSNLNNNFNKNEPNLNLPVSCNNFANSGQILTNMNNNIHAKLQNLSGIPSGVEGIAGFGSLAGMGNLYPLNHHLNNHQGINNLQNFTNLPSNISNIVTNYQNLSANSENSNTMIYDNLAQDYQQQLDILEIASQDSENLVLNYISNKPLYGMAFQKADFIRLAVSSLERSNSNKIEILDLVNDKLKLMSYENQEYPITKLMWSPDINNSNTLASSSDIIRLYKYDEENNKLNLTSALNNKKSKYSSPLTSFDWNSKNPSILGTASIDTTCTIWDLNKLNIRTQLIAHDKEVFDIAFSQNEHVFISTGADGSIRLFDLRSLEHSTIMYETKDPISRIAFNTENSHLISAMVWKKDTVNIIDSRVAMQSLMDLKSHTAPVTGMSWAPQNGTYICSVGEDKFVLIWNIELQVENPNHGPNLSYKAPEEISNVNWCFDHPEWIAITFKNQLQLLRV